MVERPDWGSRYEQILPIYNHRQDELRHVGVVECRTKSSPP